MSYDHDDYPEPDCFCEDCSLDLDEDPGGDHDESHRKCWACWREANNIPDQPWRKPRPEPGAEPPSFVAGLAAVREQPKALTKIVADQRVRIDALDRERAA